MQNHTLFSPSTVALSGIQLIEASAGTGKTHTITDLFARLIVECADIQVNQILVVTFTEAATKELRDRIRKKLCNAVTAFTQPGTSRDRFLDELAAHHPNPAAALVCLKQALSNYDDAAIYTIHAFCHKVLKEQAYESGTLFDTELITAQEHLLQEAVDDFWRKNLYQASRTFVSYVQQTATTPESLCRLVASYIHNPTLHILPETKGPATASAEQSFQQAFKKCAEAWQHTHQEVYTLLTSGKELKRTQYRQDRIAYWWHFLDRYLRADLPDSLLPDWFVKLTRQSLTAGTKKGYTPPNHYFFELCDELYSCNEQLAMLFDQQLKYLQVSLFDYVHKELADKKSEHNVLYFDDLLIKVHQSLTGRHGDLLTRNLRRRYRVALIDEFQDTDSIQYEIFSRIFRHPSAMLFLIGDPKQAIYSFRNADIFTYLQAADSVAKPQTLEKNWRSEPGLIHAVNTLFTKHKNPFVFKKITFVQPVPATSAKDALVVNKISEPPFHLWFVRTEKTPQRASPINRPVISQLIVQNVADEIIRLLHLADQKKLFIGKHLLAPHDIAVLVRTHAQAHLVQQELSRQAVPSIIHSSGYLFESDEAQELARILAAIINPNDETLIASALATSILGESANGITMLQTADKDWQSRLALFRYYHDVWNRDGFFRMFRLLMVQQKVKQRLSCLPDGERRLTNILHLAEELHKQSLAENLGMRGLAKWLAEQIHPATPNHEEHLLRLETDEAAVKIVTIHKSKGLEYPVVFCPFVWTDSRPRSSEVIFHDTSDKLQLKLDLGSADVETHKGYAAVENLAENMRLLYVALTRAKNRCYLVWGGIKDADTSAPAYLFHNTDCDDANQAVQSTRQKFMALSDNAILDVLHRYAQISDNTIMVKEISREQPLVYQPHTADSKKQFSHRTFSGHAQQHWKVTSFSALVSGQTHEMELSSHDELELQREETVKQPPEETTVFSFPAGARSGNLLHEILQELDFTCTDTQIRQKLVLEKLQAYGFDSIWLQPVCSMLHNVLSVTLDAGFALNQIQPGDRVSELGFYFPLQSCAKESLLELFSDFSSHKKLADFPPLIENLTFSPVQGYMKGYIDLVFQYNKRFYLIDWKSNLLGIQPEAYTHDVLQAVMERELYILQYHIYTLALHQYLLVRFPGYRYATHFGGVLYIFLRGVDPERGSHYGIYRDRPPAELIEEMRKRLILI